MFTDDDDPWHEAQVDVYTMMLRGCKRQGVTPKYIVSKTRVVSEGDTPPGLERAEEVTALYER